MDRWPQLPGSDGLPVPRPARARCKACGHVWLATPEEDVIELDQPLGEAPASLPPGPALSPARLRTAEQSAPVPAAPPRPPRRGWLTAGLAAGAAAAAGLVAAAAMGLWQPERLGLPAADQALAQIGLPAIPRLDLPTLQLPAIRLPAPPPPRLGISADALVRPLPAGGQVWEISGEVSNPGDARQLVPPLEVLIVSASGTPLARWTVATAATSLAPGARLGFETSAINPPAGAARVAVRLKPPGLARL